MSLLTFLSDRSTRLLYRHSSSWTMAWYVHCVSNGVTGSSRRSRISCATGVDKDGGGGHTSDPACHWRRVPATRVARLDQRTRLARTHDRHPTRLKHRCCAVPHSEHAGYEYRCVSAPYQQRATAVALPEIEQLLVALHSPHDFTREHLRGLRVGRVPHVGPLPQRQQQRQDALHAAVVV